MTAPWFGGDRLERAFRAKPPSSTAGSVRDTRVWAGDPAGGHLSRSSEGAGTDPAAQPLAPDPLQLQETGRADDPPAGPSFGAGERTLFFLALFFGTLAVALFASTLQPPAGFFVGMGWMIVLAEASGWERGRGARADGR